MNLKSPRSMVRVEVNCGDGYSQWFEWPYNGNPGRIMVGIKQDDCPESAREPMLASIPIEYNNAIALEMVENIFEQVMAIKFQTERPKP